ncbi:MAG: nucleotidyltransferase family protein [Betaproteobacteria bacterium]|jgi:molybdenum cofactor cytidylyltransferase
MRIVGILLAAGRATRFGGDKLLAPLVQGAADVAPGTPIGVASALHLVAALPRSLAVVRPGDAGLAAALRATGLSIVECDNADEGMGASLACGVAASRDADGWIVALADMPWIRSSTILAVAQAIEHGDDLAAPFYQGRRGHPVGFARRHYGTLASLGGDSGARAVIEGARDRLASIDVTDPGVLRDVDRRADLR